MRKIIDNYIQAHLKEFESAVETWDGFYHMVYEIAEWVFPFFGSWYKFEGSATITWDVMGNYQTELLNFQNVFWQKSSFKFKF